MFNTNIYGFHNDNFIYIITHFVSNIMYLKRFVLISFIFCLSLALGLVEKYLSLYL